MAVRVIADLSPKVGDCHQMSITMSPVTILCQAAHGYGAFIKRSIVKG